MVRITFMWVNGKISTKFVSYVLVWNGERVYSTMLTDPIMREVGKIISSMAKEDWFM